MINIVSKSKKSILTILVLLFVHIGTNAAEQDPYSLPEGHEMPNWKKPAGKGTPDEPYLIGTVEELYWYTLWTNLIPDLYPANCTLCDPEVALINSAEYRDTFLNMCVRLTDDIVFNENVLTSDGSLKTDPTGLNIWYPIMTNVCNQNFFVLRTYNNNTIYFDGDGHTISGLYVPAKDYKVPDEFSRSSYGHNLWFHSAGLFGNFAGSITVKNLNIKDSYFSAKDYAGGIFGYSYYMKSINGVDGYMTVNIDNCMVEATVESSRFAGGLMGDASPGLNLTITNCAHIGKVHLTSNENSGYDKNKYEHMGLKTDYCGGLIGTSHTIIDETIGMENISMPNLVMKDCYHYGDIINERNSDYRGGLWGESNFDCTTKPITSIVKNFEYKWIVDNCYFYTEDETVKFYGLTPGYETLFDDKYSDKVTLGTIGRMSLDQFASGEVCYKLNHESSDDVQWKQTLNSDIYPLSNNSGHKTVYYNEKASCNGATAGYSNEKSDESTAHTFKYVAAIEPTCEEDGVVTHYVCTKCGKTFEDEIGKTEIKKVVIDKLGHDYKIETDWSDYLHPTAIYVCQNDNSHTLDLELVSCDKNSGNEPTCFEEGTEKYTARFSYDNGYATDTKTVNIPKKVHSKVHIDETTSTCIVKGMHSHWMCEYCNSLFVSETSDDIVAKEDLETDLTEHSYDAHQWSWSTDMTECQLTLSCTVCDDKIHYDANISNDVISSPNCENEGIKNVTASYSYNNLVYTDTKKDVSIPAIGHNLNYIETEPASCEISGIEGHYICTNCKKLSRDGENVDMSLALSDFVIPKTDHKFGKVTWTWTKSHDIATVTYTCTNGDNYEVKHNGKSVLSVLQKETCTTEGRKAYIASDKFRDSIYVDSVIVSVPATGHKFSKIDAVEPTCEENGNKEYYICDNCKEYSADGIKVDGTTENDYIIISKNHIYELTDVEWTEDLKSAVFIYLCKSDIRHKEEHTVNSIVSESKEPTCTENGYTVYKASDEFDSNIYTKTQTKVIDARHIDNDGDGVCDVCQYSDIESLYNTHIDVSVKDRTIIVNGCDEEFEVFDSKGNIVARNCKKQVSLTLPGMYIIIGKSFCTKIVIR